MEKLTGWAAILLALFSLAPSLVPGAMSFLGLLVSLAALIISIFSVSSGRKIDFFITLAIVVFGVVFINDALRVWGSLPMPMNVKLTMYGLFGVVVSASIFLANKFSNK